MVGRRRVDQNIQWAWIKYIADGVQKKVSVDEIFSSSRNKSCIKPRHVDDFIVDHHYLVRWFTCNDPGDGVMCTEPRSHHNQIHPYQLYEATILQLAETLEEFGEMPTIRRAPKRQHKCDDPDDVPENSLRQVRKDLKQTKFLKENVSAERANDILVDVMNTDYNKNIYGPFNSSDSEDESYSNKTKNAYPLNRKLSKDEESQSSTDSDRRSISPVEVQTSNETDTAAMAPITSMASSPIVGLHSLSESDASSSTEEPLNTPTSTSACSTNTMEVAIRESTEEEAGSRGADARQAAVEQAAAERAAAQQAAAQQVAAEQAAAQQAAAQQAAAQQAAAQQAAAQQAAAQQAAAQQAAAQQAAAQQVAAQQATAQQAAAQQAAAQQAAAQQAAAQQAAAQQAAALLAAPNHAGANQVPLPQLAGVAMPVLNAAAQVDPQQGQMFGVYNPAVDFPEDMEERPDGYGILRQDVGGNVRRMPRNRQRLVLNVLLHYHQPGGAGYEDRLRRFREDTPGQKYLGLGKTVSQMRWSVAMMKNGGDFIWDVSTLLWTKHERLNMSFDPSSMGNHLPDRSPPRPIDRDRLMLLLSLVHDKQFTQNSRIPVAERVKILTHSISLFSKELSKRRTEVFESTNNARRRLSL
ncbi:hypothetical protein QAD02_006804 [Eretmocerus hayati]|uniref:Uncharacterized protein n=1 Tax=Eretmocerus hayati TaxID=131215 RepID=A0ACC2N481_9HYME|nr:hypothetical protein QAD02_006804 [Eretmocerus hayati]